MIISVIVVVDMCRYVLYTVKMCLDKHPKFKFAV